MKASFRWLKELLPGLKGPASEAARRLTAAGLEVEGIHEFGAGTEALVVARVVAIEPHPSKSGLRLVTVEHGRGTQRVVCGAPNVPDPGGRVVLAPLGARLPAIDLTITPRAIGGVSSEGMLCSEREMGLGEGHEGILVLAEGEPGEPGQPLSEAQPEARDTIFEINVTPNRPDALGHLGIARDLAALSGEQARAPAGAEVTTAAREDDLDAAAAGALPGVAVEAPERCPEYGAARIDGVVIGPSPRWVQRRLASLGVRPISNVVDATNLVLLELGQPTHAFDAAKLHEGIVVRTARPGEKLATLDGKERALDADDLVIADHEGPVALAGVMGGAGSEISASTTSIVLECAYFDPRSVRRSSRRHGLHTEASHRFERGIDRGGVQAAMRRLIGLILQLCPGAKLAAGPVHVVKRPFVAAETTLRSERLDALLGDRVPFDEALAILGALGCRLLGRDAAQARLAAPGFRPDLTREADLIEEVARIRGYDRVEAALPPILTQPQPLVRVDDELRQAALGLGLSEAVTYAFVAPAQLDALGAPAPVVRLSNPLTEERSVLRTSLLPGLLEALARARRRGERSLRMFTTGRTFLPPSSSCGEPALPTERRVLAAVLAGPRPAHLSKPEDHDAFDAKAVAVELVGRALRREASVEPFAASERPAHLHPRAAARVQVDGKTVGQFGMLHPDVIDRLDLGSGAVVVELDLDTLGALGRRTPQATAVPRLPAVTRDVSLLVPDAVTAGQVEALIREAAGDLCEQAEVFDLFRGGSVPEGHRSLAFHVTYRDPLDREGKEGARTLTDAEVDERHKQLVDAVSKRLGATLR